MGSLRVQPLLTVPRRCLRLSAPTSASYDPRLTRNFGLAAHIDAGKTTSTESILLRTGAIGRAGSVDRGDTVTDFTELERQRGISIGAAAAAHLPWRGHFLNLVDTPGHADFTLEVERSLRVLDGAVIILDALKGVQAQTRVVWRQATRHRQPAIAFANKMDRADRHHFANTTNSIRKKLDMPVLPLELPLFDNSGRFIGVVDLVRFCALAGTKSTPMEVPAGMLAEARDSREELTAQLAEMDEAFAEDLLSSGDGQSPPEKAYMAALRRCTIQRRVIPLLCGSAKQHIGMSSLLDATVAMLPNPVERHAAFLESFSQRLCAFAFKTVHDRHRGVLTFLRVYSGSLKRGLQFFNSTQNCTERSVRLLRPLADMYHEIQEAGVGEIVVVSGLKCTRTGDVIVGSENDLEALQALPSSISPVDQSLVVPEPVLFASIEAPSLSKVKAMDMALQALVLDDPSLGVTFNADTGQTVLSGMGDLHLEVTTERLRSEYGVDVSLGEVAIAYREVIAQAPAADTDRRLVHEAESHMDAGHVRVTMEASIDVLSAEQQSQDSSLEAIQNKFVFVNSEAFQWPRVRFVRQRAVEEGARRGLSMAGPLLRCPVTGARLHFHSLRVRGPSETDAVGPILTCTAELVRRLVERCTTNLMEPVMRVEVVVSDDPNGELLSRVISDLAHRRARILGINEASGETIATGGDGQMVLATVPMAELVGYASHVRRLTSGRADLHLQLDCYEAMDVAQQEKLLVKFKY